MIMKQQLWKIKDCKAVTEEHVTTHHKHVVFVVCLHKQNLVKNTGWKMISWRKCRDNIAVDGVEGKSVRTKYEECSKEAEGLEEWKKYGEVFRGIAEALCGLPSGKGASARDRNQVLADRGSSKGRW